MAKLSIKELQEKIPQIGKVEWIGIRRSKRSPLEVVKEVELDTENGIIGDHYRGKKRNRQVTLIQKEHLEAIAKILGKEAIDPSLTRRNIVVSGINLLSLQDRTIFLGDVELKITGLCYPCSRMEENLGNGGYNAMRGHGGLTARVEKGGVLRNGDPVSVAQSIK